MILHFNCRSLLIVLFSVFITTLILVYVTNDAIAENEVLVDRDVEIIIPKGIGGFRPRSPNNVTKDVDFSQLYLPVAISRLDNKRILRIYDFSRIGNLWENLIEKYDVCLTTQASIERIYWLPQVLDNWNGPLSVSVFVSSEEEWIVLNLYYIFLERCTANFVDRVSVHLAIPAYVNAFHMNEEKVKEYKIPELKISATEWNCNDAEGYLKRLLNNFKIPTHKDKAKLAKKIVYPQNHMRNIARKTCATHWTFSVDVDIIPRPGMAEMLQEFYQFIHPNDAPCKKCAFVIPTFELDESKPFPNTKHEVIEHFKNGTARQYHERDYDRAQHATDYSKWMTTHLEEGKTRVSHPIMSSERHTRFYEPFYVSSDKIPAFDERFLGYGLTRSSQFQEALLAGWNFSVLTPVYSIHWGLHEPPPPKKKETVAERIRNRQTTENRNLFTKILKEMKLKAREGLL